MIKAQDSFVITNIHSKYHLYINNNPHEQSNIRERKRGGCRSLVAEHWRLKPEALGSIPSGTTFFLSLCRFKGLRTVTAQIISIGLRTWVSPIYRAPNAVIKAQDSFVITNIHSKYHLYINNNPHKQSNIRERKRGGCRWVS